MRRTFMNGTWRAAVVALAALATTGACTEMPRDGAAAVSADTTVPGGAVGATMTAATVTSVGGAALDSAAGLLPDSAVVTPPPAVSVPNDTMPVVATIDDLQALATTLMIPVQGVAAGELRDSYLEARGGRVHEAIDIHAARGTPVMAATDGRLVKLFDSRAGGLMVYAADATDRFLFMYGHLENYAAGMTEGMPLRRGQVIGYVGTSGNAPPAAPHLHLAIARGRPSVAWWKGTPVNPYPLFVPPAR